MTGDGKMDAVVGCERNQLVVGSTYGFSLVLDMPEGDRNTYAIALGDVNGDGLSAHGSLPYAACFPC